MITQKQLCDQIAHAVDNIIEKVKFVKNIFKDIHDARGKVLLVGGAVRDIVLEKSFHESQDLDFEVYRISLEELTVILEKYGKVDFVGRSFGVLRLSGLDIDWSLPRKDSVGRKPQVNFDPFMAYQDAFARRDLTINAMGIDMQTKEFIDPYHGFDDIQNKILKSPNLNFFPQDPLRLLRVMQFAGRFDMQIDAQLSKVCSAMDVASLAQERVEQEFEKLFTKSKYPSKGLMWLFSIKKWQQFLPVELEMQKVYDAVDFIAQTSLKDAEKIILMWSACLLLSAPCQDKNITMQYKEAVKKLSLKGIYQRHIIAYCMQFSYAVKIKNEIQVKWLAYYLASHGTVHEMCILLQSVGEGAQAKKINELAKKSQVLFKPIQALLHGKDLQSHAQGKALGVLLEKAYQMQLEHEYISKKNLLDLLLK